MWSFYEIWYEYAFSIESNLFSSLKNITTTNNHKNTIQQIDQNFKTHGNKMAKSRVPHILNLFLEFICQKRKKKEEEEDSWKSRPKNGKGVQHEDFPGGHPS